MPIEKVKKYRYIGAIITDYNEYTEEISVRIGQFRAIFRKMKMVMMLVYNSNS